MNLNTIKKFAIAIIVASTPAFSQAAENPIKNLADWLLDFAPKLMNLGFTIAGIAFVYSITLFILNPDNKEHGKAVMTWGLGAMFIMFSFTALIDMAQKMIFTAGMDTPTVPTLSFNSTDMG